MSLAPSRLRGDRLPPEVFDLPVEKMREGYYTDAYFNHTRAALLYDDREPRVVMQVFQKHHAMLGGMDEAIAVLKLCATDWDDLTVHALHDGDWIEPWEPVMRIEGNYTYFAHLETVYLGVLARRTLISTNVSRVLEAAHGKPIIFMPARHDHHRVQTGDGYAAHVAGAVLETPVGVTSDAAGVVVGRPWRRNRPTRVDRRIRRQHRPRGHEVRRVGPAGLSHHGARRLRERLGQDIARGRARAGTTPVGRAARTPPGSSSIGRCGTRWATSIQEASTSVSCGKVRDALDADGFERVKIVASGGFTVEKIRAFEQLGVPVDAYGVGSSLIRGENDFTADIVLCDGRPASKIGRALRSSPRLEPVT